jgi:hypothetical protein
MRTLATHATEDFQDVIEADGPDSLLPVFNELAGMDPWVDDVHDVQIVRATIDECNVSLRPGCLTAQVDLTEYRRKCCGHLAVNASGGRLIVALHERILAPDG